MWESKDQGKTWKKRKQLTQAKEKNHSYVRIPYRYQPDFFAFWADGDTKKRGPSNLYFANAKGDVFMMPDNFTDDWVKPIPVK